MASLPAHEPEEFLWTLIESRDRAFARAHQAFQAMTREAREKDREILAMTREAREKDLEIQRMTAWTRELEAAPREKDAEIERMTAWARELEAAPREKDAEIERLTDMANLRQNLLDRVQGSAEYKLGLLLLHPWEVLRSQLRKKSS